MRSSCMVTEQGTKFRYLDGYAQVHQASFYMLVSVAARSSLFAPKGVSETTERTLTHIKLFCNQSID